MPLETTTSWTVKMEKGHNAFWNCLALNGGYVDLAKNVCQRPLHTLCPSWVDVALNNSCHKFMAATRMSYGENISLGTTSVEQYTHCMAPQRQAMKTCVHLLKEPCLNRRFRAAKVLRMPMCIIEDLLNIFPNLKIIHQVRDPRAIIQSRSKGSMLSFVDIGKEAKYLCQKMMSNIRALQYLNKKYPGLVLFNSYENLARKPTTSLELIYQHTGVPRSDKVQSWLSDSSENGYNISVAWRRHMPSSMRRMIDSQCKELYKIIGVDL